MRMSDWSSDVCSSDLTLAAFREVEDALVSVVKLAEQRRSLEAQRAAVAEALRHATNRYQAGYSPYLEQLDAQRSLLNTDLSLLQLRTDQLNAVVSLYQALGGGWGGIPHCSNHPPRSLSLRRDRKIVL